MPIIRFFIGEIYFYRRGVFIGEEFFIGEDFNIGELEKRHGWRKDMDGEKTWMGKESKWGQRGESLA